MRGGTYSPRQTTTESEEEFRIQNIEFNLNPVIDVSFFTKYPNFTILTLNFDKN